MQLAGALAVDDQGRAYLTGDTYSTNLPTVNGFQTGVRRRQRYDAYVAVIDTTQAGAAGLVYSTYLGGTGTDMGMGIAYAGNRIVYVTGEADTGFPTANALDASYNGGTSDAFIAKIDTSQAGAASLLYSTFLGGIDSPISAGTSPWIPRASSTSWARRTRPTSRRWPRSRPTST